MINRLVTLLVAIVIVGVIALFLWWVMGMLPIPGIIVTVVWILFALVVFLALLGLFGYGPMRDRIP